MIAHLKKLAKLLLLLTFLTCAAWLAVFHGNTAGFFQWSINASAFYGIERGQNRVYIAPPLPPNLPHEAMLQPIGVVLQQQWAQDLHLFLKTADSKLITIISANFEYTQHLLNWLINACVVTKTPCKDVLVLAFDRRLYSYLMRKKISTIYINRDEFIKPGVHMHSQSSYIYLVRFAVMRVINFWGFDVLSIDLDAIILKNITTLLDKYGYEDIVGSVGHYPFDMNKKWGVTLCMGAVLFRATPHIELVWNASAAGTIQDDQVTINYVLNDLDIKWHQASNPNENYCAQGISPSGLKVTILSNSIICRNCEHTSLITYYIWHHRAAKSFDAKLQQAVKANLWLLDPHWNFSLDLTKNLTGIEWLNSLLHVPPTIIY